VLTRQTKGWKDENSSRWRKLLTSKGETRGGTGGGLEETGARRGEKRSESSKFLNIDHQSMQAVESFLRGSRALGINLLDAEDDESFSVRLQLQNASHPVSAGSPLPVDSDSAAYVSIETLQKMGAVSETWVSSFVSL
jgi:hypothetical protein